MTKYITLPEARAHLNVDFDEDDDYIAILMSLVQEVVQVEIGEDLAELENEAGNIPKGLRQAMLLLLGHFYANRESVLVGVGAIKLPYGFDFLVAPYKNYTVI